MKIQKSEHVFICGSTGSGKTTLAGIYTQYLPKVYVLDIKGLFEFEFKQDKENVLITNDMNELKRQDKKFTHFVYRPDHENLNIDHYNTFFEFCYKKGNNAVIIDEAMGVCTQFNIPEFYKAILTRGRQLNVQAYTCSQRPSQINQLIITEATHVFVFRLNSFADRKKLELCTGQEKFLNNIQNFEFYYYNMANGMLEPKKSKLILKGV